MRLACSALVLFAVSAGAQEALSSSDSLGPYGRATQSWIALRVAPGRESVAIERVREAGEWSLGPLGSAYRTKGTGSPHRVVACGVDETSYIVSNVTDDGYLRVHTSGARAMPALWNQFHMGQRVVVITTGARARAVPGVFGVRSTHLWRRAAGAADPVPTLEDLWVDVGAKNRAEVAALGIRVLDPVFRDMPDWSVGDAVVGPYAANRAGCAAVSAASNETPASGRTTFVISTQSAFAWAGLNALVRRLGDVDSVVVAHTSPPGWARGVTMRAQFPQTLVESIREAELRRYFEDVAVAANVPSVSAARIRLSAAFTRPAQVVDSLARFAELLGRLTDTYAVAGDEGPVRDVVQARLPAWARDSVVVDTAGNLILAMGPDRDTVVFLAHMDEVGFEVERVGDNGIATLRTRGGFYPTLFTGQTALLHLKGGERSRGCRPTSGNGIRGVFLLPDTAPRQGAGPRPIQAWFGSQLSGAGTVAGAAVTSYKCTSRFGTTRFSARAIDDRAGTTALIMALDGINRAQLDHKVIFVWSVREEGGLEGARAAAASLGPTVRRVYAIDTFVSADSPLETGRFAVTPIGEGAVLRGADNGGVVTPDDIERVQRIARQAGAPLQVGTTNGSTDAVPFTALGAPAVMLGWPLRYSHSPAEVIDLRDIRSLVRLVTALATASPR